ncbi:MAG: hypothetical protein MR384_00785 [Lachnospiraceae bacterium]|nr:hypothetical protein [Lachnospiraceae bacterium]
MGKIIEINRKHVNKEYINQLYKEISTITSDAEMTDTEDGEILLDSISEMRINELETKINMELLKGGYSLEEIYG